MIKVLNSHIDEWNTHLVTIKLKKLLKDELKSLEAALLGGDCANNNSAYIACVSEYKVIKSLLEDSFIKVEEVTDEDYQR